MSNIQTVKSIYAAFGKGDIPNILSHLVENVEWEYGMSDNGVPWLEARHGRADVPKFFESLAALEFQKFQPKIFMEADNLVVALIDVDFVVKATGKKIAEEDEVHIWHFDSQGRVIKFCHKIDTHQHWAAYQKQ
jgi:uncharacterized protein